MTASGAGSPGPASDTSIATVALVARTRTRTSPRPCSAALVTRFAQAWARRSGSASTRAGSFRSPPPIANGSTDDGRLDAQGRPVGGDQCAPGGFVLGDERREVDELRAGPAVGATPGRREIVEGEARAAQLEVDRRQPRGLARQPVQAQVDGGERTA